MVLSGLTGTLVALAGCTDNSDTDSDTPTNSTDTATEPPVAQSDTFAGVRVDAGQLVVTLARDMSARWVHRFGPDGNLAEKAKVALDGREAQFDLVGQNVDGYTPGEHRLAAVKNDEPVGGMTVDLEPEVSLTSFHWAKNHPYMGWDKSANNWETHAAFHLENRGSGPAMLTALGGGTRRSSFALMRTNRHSIIRRYSHQIKRRQSMRYRRSTRPAVVSSVRLPLNARRSTRKRCT